jgi:hypothetical protein
MSDTKERIFKRTEEARDLLRHHPLTPEQAINLFTSIGVGAFRYSAALVPWTEKEEKVRGCVGPSILMGVGPTMDHGIGRVHPTERDGRHGISPRNGAGTMPPPSTVPQTRG